MTGKGQMKAEQEEYQFAQVYIGTLQQSQKMQSYCSCILYLLFNHQACSLWILVL